ncbi:hypothetical protein CCP2SC5_530011 [Azospirillaceae bacterium]
MFDLNFGAKNELQREAPEQPNVAQSKKESGTVMIDSRPNILVVDDRPMDLEYLRLVLSQVDATVTLAHSGKEALVMARQREMALILMDVNMPVMDGFAVAGELQREDRTRRIPILFLTAAYRDDAARIRGYDAGAVDYIEKPIDRVVLLSKVRVFLDLYITRKHLQNALRQLEDHNRRLETEIHRYREADAALRRERNLFISGPVAMFRWRAAPDWPVEYVSRNIFDLFGYDPGHFIVGALSYPEVVHAADRHVLDQKAEEARVAGQSGSEKEYRILCAGGDVRWVMDRTVAVFDDRSRLTHFDGYLIDITQRRVAEQALNQSEQRWTLALRGTNDGIWDRNLETGEMFYSDRFREMLGYGPEELPNRLEEWETRIHPDDRDRVFLAIEEHFDRQTSFYACEYRLRCKDGSYKWILARGQALWDTETGKPVRISGSYTDVSEWKSVHAVMRAREERYRRYFSLGLIGMAVVSIDRRWLEVNDRLCEMFGYGREEMLTLTWADLLSPEDATLDLLRYKQVLARDRGEADVRFTGDRRFVRKDGQIIKTRISAHCIRREDGTPDHFVALIDSIDAPPEAVSGPECAETL